MRRFPRGTYTSWIQMMATIGLFLSWLVIMVGFFVYVLAAFLRTFQTKFMRSIFLYSLGMII